MSKIILLTLAVSAGVLLYRWLPVFPQPASDGEHVVVDKWRNRLYFYRGDGKILRFPVATGKEPDETPQGWMRVVAKEELSPPETNPQLGLRWLGLSARGHEDGLKYGIHGTDEPESIGHHASGGCIRMKDEHVVQLYEQVNEGTPVKIRGFPWPVCFYYRLLSKIAFDRPSPGAHQGGAFTWISNCAGTARRVTEKYRAPTGPPAGLPPLPQVRPPR